MTFIEFIEQSQGIQLSNIEKKVCEYYQSLPEDKWITPTKYTDTQQIMALYRVYKYMRLENA